MKEDGFHRCIRKSLFLDRLIVDQVGHHLLQQIKTMKKRQEKSFRNVFKFGNKDTGTKMEKKDDEMLSVDDL